MSTFPNRCLMLDPARLLERKEYYFSLLPWLKEWGYNRLHLHLTDDQGCALVFPSHPELASTGAFTAEEMRRLIQEASRSGLEVIPEIESLGHTQFITKFPQYRHLGKESAEVNWMNAIDPALPQTRQVLRDLLRDTAEIFPAKILHVGLDEVDFSGLARYRRVPREEHWKIFTRHAVWVQETVRKLGKRPAMWGDHILSTRKMAEKFHKDVLIFDWHYGADFDPASLDFFLQAGFEVWGAPATMWHHDRVVTQAGDWANTRYFAAHALARKKRGVSGMVNTVWCPWRYLPGAMDWPIAWAGRLFREEREQADFGVEFCRSFYGLSAGAAPQVAEALRTLHDRAPDWRMYDSVFQAYESTMFTREHRRQCELLHVPLRAIEKTLVTAQSGVRRNAERYQDLILSVRLITGAVRRGLQENLTRPLPGGKALYRDCLKHWDRARYQRFEYPLDQNILRFAGKLAQG